MSRASQHRERSLRFGAMGVPSVESFGGGGEGGVEVVDQSPIISTRGRYVTTRFRRSWELA